MKNLKDHKTIKEFLLANYNMDQLKDIVNHGCSGGVMGLCYYTETVAFHDHFEEEIWDMLYDDGNGQGVNVMQLIGMFNGAKDVGSMDQLKNLLCWCAVEDIAREIVENEGDQV